MRGCLAGGDRLHQIGREAVRGQRQQTLAFLDERVADQAPVRILGHRAGVRDASRPLDELGVQILDGGEPARGEERVPEVLDRALDLALPVAAVRRARERPVERILNGRLAGQSGS